MNIDEAINDLIAFVEADIGHGDLHMSSIYLAIDALREKQERDNPKPLTLEQLRERNGKPVYIRTGEGNEGWGICERTGDSFMFGEFEPDSDFYNMTYNDPVGHFGLHVLSWLAYDHKPKEDK